MPATAAKDTPRRILDVAERLVQTRGFNGFSYADISAELKIRKASLHHHFATKAELGRALIRRYQENFLSALNRIDSQADASPDRLALYVTLYRTVLKADRMCLCGMLAAEFATLPRSMRDGIQRFFDANEAWLSRTLEAGRSAGVLHFKGSSRTVAQSLISGLEGAMLVARTYRSVARFDAAAARLVDGLRAKRRHAL